jgi:hypothetical protein
MSDTDVATATRAEDEPGVQPWSDIVIAGPTAPIPPERLEHTLADLQKRLSPDVARAIEGSLTRLLSLSETTYLDLLNALSVMVGEELGSFIAYLMYERAYLTDNEALGSAAAPDAWLFLRMVAAKFGTQVGMAYERATRPKGDWLYINRQTRVDQLTGTSTILIELEQVSGDKVVLECAPGSMLRLVAHELHCLNAVPNKDVFTDDILEEVHDAISQFLEFTTQRLVAAAPADTPDRATVDLGEAATSG